MPWWSRIPLAVIWLAVFVLPPAESASIRGAAIGSSATRSLKADVARNSSKAPSWACSISTRPLRNGTVQLHTSHTNNSSQAANSVIAVDPSSLYEHVQKAEANLLVVFYAPWCPHCKKFVMEGEDGHLASAPLEQLSRSNELVQEEVVVLKFDTENNTVPTNYEVNYVPKIYKIAPHGGGKEFFKGDPQNLTGLKQFAVSPVQITTPAPQASGPTVIVMAKHAA